MSISFNKNELKKEDDLPSSISLVDYKDALSSSSMTTAVDEEEGEEGEEDPPSPMVVIEKEEDEERERFRGIVETLLEEQGLSCGAIVRTVAEGMAADVIARDLRYTLLLWDVVQQRCREANVKTLVHEDLSLPLRVLRDLVTTDVEQILVDSEAASR